MEMSVKSLGRAVHDGKMKSLFTIMIKDCGFKLVSDHKHLVFKKDGCPPITTPKTTSDARSWHMMLSTLKKTTGIDFKAILKNGASKKAAKAFKMSV